MRTEFELYRIEVNNKTRKYKKELFNNWDGHDYYDGEYIKDNLNQFASSHKFYPTIDHKISVYFGYLNNLSTDEISNIENLCITKRSINSKKRILNEESFLQYYI